MKSILKKQSNKNPNLLSHVTLVLVTSILLVIIIQWDRGLFKAEFREGDIALRSIYAPYDFSTNGEINKQAMEAARKKAVGSVLPFYVFKTGLRGRILKKVQSVVNSIVSLKEKGDIGDKQRQLEIKKIAGSKGISEALVGELLELDDIHGFLDRAKKAVSEIMNKGIISVSEYNRLKGSGTTKIRLGGRNGKGMVLRGVDSFFTLKGLRKGAARLIGPLFKSKRERRAFLDFIDAALSVNVIFDKEKTGLDKHIASQRIQPIYNIINVKKNEVILNKGERISKDNLIKLNVIEKKESSAAKVGGLFAIAILVGLFILLAALYIKVYEPSLAGGNKGLILLALICILVIFTAKIIVISPWSSNLIPVAVGSMLIAMLINGRLAIVITCLLSILIGMISGNRLDIAGTSIVGGIIGVLAVRGVRRRSQLITAGISVGFANMSYLIGVGLARSLDFNAYITESLFGLANGIISAVLVTGILPIFENIFKITTDISLLELSDPNHPLLKKMVVEAPGTYHHSLVVGNLAEAACEAIGANSLLARVGSYFHDIGKIEKAAYFSENQIRGDSTHDKLSPTMSSLIITNHVKNGVELAQRYKLNKKIIDIIKQHHGTGLVFYFFKRAMEKVPDEKIREQSFRYPGPKPQTKEAACVLLADSVEAASRALDDPTPSRVKGLVRKVINNKFIDGQLDECDLTLKDMEKIARIFTHILRGIFHTRVEYPEEAGKTTD